MCFFSRSCQVILTGCVLLLLLVSMAHAESAMEWPGPWKPWIELGGFGSTELSYGEMELFVPRGNETTLAFLDFRSKAFTEDDELEGNFSAGFRHMLSTPLLGEHWNLGYWLGGDVRRSASRNTFGQLSTGVEALSADWDLRVNGYVPISDPKPTGPGGADVQLSGGQLFLTGGQKIPLYGFDGEVGWRVPIERLGVERAGLAHLDQAVHEWRVFAGSYHFDDDQVSQSISGPRVRSEWRVLDLIPGAPGSRLTLAFEFQRDEVRDDKWKGGLQLRIPLGGLGSKPTTSTGAHQRRAMRMTERLVHDVDIVLSRSAQSEPVVNARTGLPISRVVTVDGAAADPEGDITGAGTNSVVIADGSAGTISPTNTINMNNGQVIMGGGSSLAVRGANTGAMGTFTAPGTRGTFNNSGAGVDADLLNTATNATIQSVDLVTTDPMANAISLGNSTNVLIDNVGINASGDAAVGIFCGGQFTVNNSTIMTSGDNAPALASATGQSIINNLIISTTGDNALGIQALGTSQVTVNNSTTSTIGNNADGIESSGRALLTVNGGSITSMGTNASGVRAFSSSAFFTPHSLLLNGVFLDGGGQLGTVNATITGSRITAGVGFDEILVTTNGGTAMYNLSAFGNTLDSGAGTIRLNETSGDINVTQGAPGRGAGGLDVLNGIAAGNVIIPGNAIDFNQPTPPTP